MIYFLFNTEKINGGFYYHLFYCVILYAICNIYNMSSVYCIVT